ncbi:hypothetical protein D3C87_1781590 [compost metagenome]
MDFILDVSRVSDSGMSAVMLPGVNVRISCSESCSPFPQLSVVKVMRPSTASQRLTVVASARGGGQSRVSSKKHDAFDRISRPP